MYMISSYFIDSVSNNFDVFLGNQFLSLVKLIQNFCDAINWLTHWSCSVISVEKLRGVKMTDLPKQSLTIYFIFLQRLIMPICSRSLTKLSGFAKEIGSFHRSLPHVLHFHVQTVQVHLTLWPLLGDIEPLHMEPSEVPKELSNLQTCLMDFPLANVV